MDEQKLQMFGGIMYMCAGIMQTCTTAYQAIELAKEMKEDEISPYVMKATLYGSIWFAYKAMTETVDREELIDFMSQYYSSEEKDLWMKAEHSLLEFIKEWDPAGEGKQ